MTTSSALPGSTPPPQLAVLVQVTPSPKPVHWPANVKLTVRPVPLYVGVPPDNPLIVEKALAAVRVADVISGKLPVVAAPLRLSVPP